MNENIEKEALHKFGNLLDVLKNKNNVCLYGEATTMMLDYRREENEFLIFLGTNDKNGQLISNSNAVIERDEFEIGYLINENNGSNTLVMMFGNDLTKFSLRFNDEYEGWIEDCENLITFLRDWKKKVR